MKMEKMIEEALKGARMRARMKRPIGMPHSVVPR